MLMAAMQMHMDSSITSTPPWPPIHLADHHHHGLTPPSPSTPSSSLLGVGPPRCARNHRSIAKTKRRPRPSRRLPTTYISADPASFRRMVQQVTGASGHHDLPALPPQEEEPTKMNAAELLLIRPAPIKQLSRTTGTEMLLPTLDTSAFLLSQTSCDDGPSSPAAATPAFKVEAGARGASCDNDTACTFAGGFPTLDSWDHHAPLF